MENTRQQIEPNLYILTFYRTSPAIQYLWTILRCAKLVMLDGGRDKKQFTANNFVLVKNIIRNISLFLNFLILGGVLHNYLEYCILIYLYEYCRHTKTYYSFIQTLSSVHIYTPICSKQTIVDFNAYYLLKCFQPIIFRNIYLQSNHALQH